MGIKDIAGSSAVTNLLQQLKSIPTSASVNIRGLMTAKTAEERFECIKTMPEDVIRKLIKVITYMVLSSGVLIKESLHEIYLTPEIKDFFEKVTIEVHKIGKITLDSVCTAVDIVIGIAAVTLFIGIVAFGVFIILNPAVGIAIGGVTLFIELFLLLSCTADNKSRMDV